MGRLRGEAEANSDCFPLAALGVAMTVYEIASHQISSSAQITIHPAALSLFLRRSSSLAIRSLEAMT